MARGSGPSIGWLTVGVMVVLGGLLALVPRGATEDGPDCGGVFQFDGARYGSQADPPRVPRVVRVAGQVEDIGCGDVRVIGDAGAVHGVPPEVAVVIDGDLFVRDGATAPAWLMRAAMQPVVCRRSTVVGGTWWNEDAERREDEILIRPYTMQMQATEGEHLPLSRWQRLRIDVEVTEATEISPEDEKQGWYGERPMRVDVHCDGDRFVADRLYPG